MNRKIEKLPSHQPPAKPEAWKCEPLKAVGSLATSKVAALLLEQL
jgi:hypothetical protein